MTGKEILHRFRRTSLAALMARSSKKYSVDQHLIIPPTQRTVFTLLILKPRQNALLVKPALAESTETFSLVAGSSGHIVQYAWSPSLVFSTISLPSTTVIGKCNEHIKSFADGSALINNLHSECSKDTRAYQWRGKPQKERIPSPVSANPYP